MEPSSVSHEGDDIQTYFTPNQTHNPMVAAAVAAAERERGQVDDRGFHIREATFPRGEMSE